MTKSMTSKISYRLIGLASHQCSSLFLIDDYKEQTRAQLSHSNRKLWICCVETFGLHIFSKLFETDLTILPSFFNLRQIYLATREKYILQFERNTLCGNFWAAYIFKTSRD